MTLEERVEALERSRLKQLARLNAHETLLLEIWAQFAIKYADDASEFAAHMREFYRQRADMPARMFPGADPAQLDLLSQEYAEAIDDVVSHLQTLVARAASMGRPPREE
jgi:hypothetical protein